MKILYVTTIGVTMDFFVSLIKKLISEGHHIDIATNDSYSKVNDIYASFGCEKYTISCSRSPFSKGNIKAIGEIRKIVINGKYDIVHCHTPIAAATVRLACRGVRKNSNHPVKVIYTAHGFHFYKGAPLKNWFIFYPIEKLCAHFTDVLITINNEDYVRAQKSLKAKRIEYVPGVGIDLKRFNNEAGIQDYDGIRAQLGIPKDAFVVLSIGELNDNKNHITVLKALNQIKENKIHYVIAGEGDNMDILKRYSVNSRMDSNIHLLGKRDDVPKLLHAADVYALPSIREGLNVSLMEAMASGLPCICSRIRGNVDLIESPKGGYLLNANDTTGWSSAIKAVFNETKENRINKGMFNREKVQSFSDTTVNQAIQRIYNEI